MTEFQEITELPIRARPVMRKILEICVRNGWCNLFGALLQTCREFCLEAKVLLPEMKNACPHHKPCSNCFCDCEGMIHHRIRNKVKNWLYPGGATTQETYWISDYSKYQGRVCRRCFLHHWRNCAVRPMRFCLSQKINSNQEQV